MARTTSMFEANNKNRLSEVTTASDYDYISSCPPPGSQRDIQQDDVNEWIAENILIFTNEAYFCYSGARTENEEWEVVLKSPSKGFPKHVSFKWKEKSGLVRPLNADEYLEQLFRGIEEDIKNPNIFPGDANKDFPPEFLDRAAKIFNRLCRVYAILLGNPSLEKRNQNQIFDRALKQILYYCFYWKLVKERVAELLFPNQFQQIHVQYEKDLISYKNKEETLGRRYGL